MKIERLEESPRSILQRQCESEASSSSGTGHAHGCGLCFCNVGLSVYWGHVCREKQLGRVSSALGIGIGRTRSLSSPWDLRSVVNVSLCPSANSSGDSLTLGAALSTGMYCCGGFVARAPPSATPEKLLYQAGAILKLDRGQSLAINVSCDFQNTRTCILDHGQLRERGVHASLTIYRKGAVSSGVSNRQRVKQDALQGFDLLCSHIAQPITIAMKEQNQHARCDQRGQSLCSEQNRDGTYQQEQLLRGRGVPTYLSVA